MKLLSLSLLLAGGAIAAWGSLFGLAALQGVTEFLPVSSSGHLVLAKRVLGVGGQPLILETTLHLGTLLAVLWVYRDSVRELLRDARAFRLGELGCLLLASAPLGLVGITLKEGVAVRFEDPRSAAWGLLVTAVVLCLGELGRRRRGDGEVVTLGAWRALAIGLAQALAILPGVSRSGATISMALILGLAPAAAARFSFLLCIPAILGAAVVNLSSFEGGSTMEQASLLGSAGSGVTALELLLAGAVAGLVGWLSLRSLLAVLNRGRLVLFAPYCAFVGIAWLVFG